jgi:hypothetical protein
MEAFDILWRGIGVLENPRVFPQESQAFGRLLEEELYDVSPLLVHALSCAAAAWRDAAGF